MEVRFVAHASFEEREREREKVVCVERHRDRLYVRGLDAHGTKKSVGCEDLSLSLFLLLLQLIFRRRDDG